MPAVDHLILAVGDLDDAATRLSARTGLAVLPGGAHPDWGTANRIVPLGGAYLELVAVVDAEVAATSAFGRVVTRASAGGREQLAGWAAAVDDLDAVAARLDLEVRRGRRTLPTGGTLTWSMAGVDEALPRGLPFFLRWDDEAANPARTPAAHRTAPDGVRWIEVGGPRSELDRWLGPHDLDLRSAAAASPGPLRAAIGLGAGGGEVVVPAPASPTSGG